MENMPTIPFDEHNKQVHEDWMDTVVAPGRLDNRHVETLREQGFEAQEITRLLAFREHLYENTEMRQRIEDNPYLGFIRWLYRQGQLSEEE